MRAENLSIAAAFDLSYRDLAGDDQRLFRRLGLHPGTDIDSYAAAALHGCSLADARRGLGELFDHHLATEPVSGRFRLHDLIREHARALAETDELEDRNAAIDRLTDYYVNAATAVGRHFERGDPEKEQSPAEVPDPGTRTEAAAWMEAERANLQAIVNHAASRERPRPGLAISAAMSGFLRAHGHWTQMENLYLTALETARKAGSQHSEAGALVDLGIVQRLRGDYGVAAATLRRALGLCYELSDQHGQAQALVALGIVQRLAVGYPTASATLTRALALYEIVRDWIGQADALNELGFVQRLTGDSDIAKASHERALELYQTHRDRLGQADSLRYLGRAHQELGNYASMASCYDEALLLYRALEDPLGQAHALSYLGTAQHVSEKYLDAEATLNTALGMYRELGHRLGQAEVHNHLGDLYSVSDPARALGHHEQALAIVRGMSAILEEARALEGIGTCDIHDGHPGQARTHLRRAMELYHHLGSPYATRVGETLRFHRL
jgi:tetratricopeptide (TPR) repeat protein